jgi:hypothetical protein
MARRRVASSFQNLSIERSESAPRSISGDEISRREEMETEALTV